MLEATIPQGYTAELLERYRAFRFGALPAGRGVSQLRDTQSTSLSLLLGLTGLVLLITCGNLATLMLARAGAREREIAMRVAMGAPRRRLVTQMVVESLLDHFVSGAPLFVPGTAAGIHVAAEADFEEDPADAEIIDQIKELIETRVRPAVAQDGGDIAYKGYRDGHLYLTMHGACSGCPSSAVTLKRGIESLIRHYVPEVETVEAV